MLGRVALNLNAVLCIAKAFGVDVSEVSPRLAQQIETPHLTPDEIELLANYRNADREGKDVILSVSSIAPKKQQSAQNDEATPGSQAKEGGGEAMTGELIGYALDQTAREIRPAVLDTNDGGAANCDYYANARVLMFATEKSMSSRLKRFLARFARPWRRWTQEELDAVAERLEQAPPEGIDASMLATEWIINHHLPDDVIRTEADYKKVLCNIRATIEETARNPPPPRLPPPQITSHEFERLLAPHLRLLDALPRTFHQANEREFLEDLYRTCSDNTTTAWQGESFMFGKYATENLDFRVVTASASSAIHAYNTLLAARHDGCTHVIGVSAFDGACSTCRKRVSGKRFSIADLLAAYEQPGPDSPNLPHIRCRHIKIGYLCRCVWRDEIPTPPGADPEFAARLDRVLDAHLDEVFKRGSK